MFRKKRKPDESIYGDYEDKFDPSEPLPEKKQTVLERLRLLSYGTVALALFIFGLLLFAASLTVSIVTAGSAGLYTGIMGILAFFSAVAGILVTLYGHFAVRMEGRIKWLAVLIPNSILAGLLLVLYVIGLAS
ncbi:MAG: hypothetical protein IJS22_09685 [Lachnospiraceae bacterium]|nr:hypothetical protein [Lachnospiraceae bacterium]